MSLLLNTPYRILFAAKPTPDEVKLEVTEVDGIPEDNFFLELETCVDTAVRKCRMTGIDSNSFALCSDGSNCLNGNPGERLPPRVLPAEKLPAEELPADESTGDDPCIKTSFTSQQIEHGAEWLVPVGSGMLRLTLYMTLINEGEEVHPCEDDQPEPANPDDDPVKRTVGAYPMVFEFPGVWGSGGKGKKVKVIWKKDY